MTTKHGWHWPREEQIANAHEDAFDFPGDPAAAAAVNANWAALLPPYVSSDDPQRPEFNNIDDTPERLDWDDREEERFRQGQWRG